jgi:alkylated DNA repair dioxygenase AlkB
MNFNRYDSGEHSLAFHADNEPLFKDDKGESTIVSLSFGAERFFEIKHNYEKKTITLSLQTSKNG